MLKVFYTKFKHFTVRMSVTDRLQTNVFFTAYLNTTIPKQGNNNRSDNVLYCLVKRYSIVITLFTSQTISRKAYY